MSEQLLSVEKSWRTVTFMFVGLLVVACPSFKVMCHCWDGFCCVSCRSVVTCPWKTWSKTLMPLKDGEDKKMQVQCRLFFLLYELGCWKHNFKYMATCDEVSINSAPGFHKTSCIDSLPTAPRSLLVSFAFLKSINEVFPKYCAYFLQS